MRNVEENPNSSFNLRRKNIDLTVPEQKRSILEQRKTSIVVDKFELMNYNINRIMNPKEDEKQGEEVIQKLQNKIKKSESIGVNHQQPMLAKRAQTMIFSKDQSVPSVLMKDKEKHNMSSELSELEEDLSQNSALRDEIFKIKETQEKQERMLKDMQTQFAKGQEVTNAMMASILKSLEKIKGGSSPRGQEVKM